MKIRNPFILFLCISTTFPVCGQSYMSQDKPWQFNFEMEKALQVLWDPLFDEAREKVQNIKNTPSDTKPIELLHTIGDDFCQGFFGSCDETSLNARFRAGCGIARDIAIARMQENDVGFVKNNTELLLASYTNCLKLADDATESHIVPASIEVADWNVENIEKSHTTWTEKLNNHFQEKVSNIWDVFTKKMTNFVRSVQGFTGNVNLRG